MVDEKRSEKRDKGEIAVGLGFADAVVPATQTVVTGQVPPTGKCPTCGRDVTNS